MKRFSYTAFLSAGVLFAGLASAQTNRGSYFHDTQWNDPYYRNDRGYNNDDYNRQRGYRNDQYGYGRNSGSLISQVVSDIDVAASRARLDGHEAKHFNEAAQRLQEFQRKWARGNFDTGRLDKAIDNIQHLVNADRVHPRDRETLSRDLYALRQLRSNRQYGGYGDYGDDRYNRYNRRSPN